MSQFYAEIMGVKEEWFDKICENIKTMVRLKKAKNLGVTIGLQMVLIPEYEDQIIPLAELGKELRLLCRRIFPFGFLRLCVRCYLDKFAVLLHHTTD